MGAYSGILINKKIIVHAPVLSIQKKILDYNGKDFIIEPLLDNQYKFIANYSLGVAVRKDGIRTIERINIKATLNSVDNNSTELVFKSSLRREPVVIFLLWLLFIYGEINDPDIPLWVNVGLFPALVVLFWLNFRTKENALLAKVESYFVG